MTTFVKALMIKIISHVISHNATSLLVDIIVPLYQILCQKRNTRKEEAKKLQGKKI